MTKRVWTPERASKLTMLEAFEMCPYRTVMGSSMDPGLVYAIASGDHRAIAENIGSVIAIIDTEEISPYVEEVVQQIRAGQRVLLMSTNKEARDRTRTLVSERIDSGE